MDLDRLYRAESGRVLATLIRLLGGFEEAEEALHDAFAAAAEQWRRTGVPNNPRAWLVSTGRFKAIDRIRRRVRFREASVELARQAQEDVNMPPEDTEEIRDDVLRLMFTCCHPTLPSEARTALALREICGLTTEEIARAFLARPSAIAQRIVRAKQKIRDERLPYEVPDRHALPGRLATVLQAIYLVFNEGYSATSGDHVVRQTLCDEAIRLGRLLVELMPTPEAQGLLALMLLHEARRTTRQTVDGDVILLADQDRSLWNRAQIAEGAVLVDKIFRSGRPGLYALQAAIAALHATAGSIEATDWAEIAGLYDLLYAEQPTPVVALNRAVAIAERDGAAEGLMAIDAVMAGGALADYAPAHAARAELLRRSGRPDEARKAYSHALGLSRQEPERRFLTQRIAALR